MIKVDCPAPTNEITQLLHRRSGRARERNVWDDLYQPKILPSGNDSTDLKMRNLLKQAFSEKCGYCECIEAGTIDHFWPRNPEGIDRLNIINIDRTWDWDNLILCCSTCQSFKRNSLPFNTAGDRIINPREDEPLYYLDINTKTGHIIARPIKANGIEQCGLYTLQILGLDHREDIADARRRVYRDIMRHIEDIADPESPQEYIGRAWSELQSDLNPRRPYLAIAYQLFTRPSDDEEVLLQRIYEVIPESYAALARFRRELPPYPEAD